MVEGWAEKLYGRRIVKPPFFITCQHPKATTSPDRESIKRLLAMGFAGQRKVHGHRAQLHVSATGELVAFTRQGTRHTAALPAATVEHLATNYRPKTGWTVLDAEWQKQESKIYLFDLIKLGTKSLQTLNYEQRYAELRGQFVIGPGLAFLVLLRDVAACEAVLADGSPYTEGLVFRELRAPGFHDTSIIRCRKSGMFFEPLKT